MRSLFSLIGVISVLFLTIPTMAGGPDPRARTPIKIPDISGFVTLKCDFHIHTVFSDGSVWPDIRPEEAWREGLDAIAITDHIEYQPHKDDLPTSHNRSYEIARPRGDSLAIMVIRGSEVTRDMPPGHLNAIFIEDSQLLDTENWRDAIAAAQRQGAFIFWNHPGWKGQQSDGVARWYPEHTELVERGMLHGIEVVNEREYYPEAHRWCLQKNLTMLSNSDIHNPLNLDYHVHDGDHRPTTLVFATEESPQAIKEALFAHRTAVYSGKILVGKEEFLRPIFEASVKLLNPSVTLTGTRGAYLQLENRSDLTFNLAGSPSAEEIEVPEELEIQAGKTVLFPIRATSGELSGGQSFALPYTVDNLKIGPDESMQVRIEFEVEFVPSED